MAYFLDGFDVLKTSAANLDIDLNLLLRRYDLDYSDEVEPGLLGAVAGPASEVPKDRLTLLLERMTLIKECTDTDRLTARNALLDIANRMEVIKNEGNLVQKKQATSLLLGAILHRYFRIQAEYLRNPLKLYASKPENSSLFCALRDVIFFTVDSRGKKITNRQELDSATVITCLDVFRQNMFEVRGEQPAYMDYPHFAADPNFATNLNKIIETHGRSDEAVLKQFQAINFIQSLAQQLENQIKETIPVLCRLLVQLSMLDWSTVTNDVLDAHIREHIGDETIKNRVLGLLRLETIQENLANMDLPTFIDEIKKCQADIASYTLFGSFMLVLQSESVGEHVKHCLRQALSKDGKRYEDITAELKISGIKFLQQFLEDNPGVVLDLKWIGNKRELVTEIAQTEMHLINAGEAMSMSFG